jgi:endonuclease/exonuclease/phosphatase family metal-dependent hydrolase
LTWIEAVFKLFRQRGVDPEDFILIGDFNWGPKHDDFDVCKRWFGNRGTRAFGACVMQAAHSEKRSVWVELHWEDVRKNGDEIASDHPIMRLEEYE